MESMTISQIIEKMIAFSDGNIHDIDHFIRVWTYARTIGELENLDRETQFLLEVAAITHDIACPLCRVKYGNTNGKYQEEEGVPMVKEFLSDTGIAEEVIDRVAFLVGHHHTFSGIDGIDYQILIEADYIANATENGYGQLGGNEAVSGALCIGRGAGMEGRKGPADPLAAAGMGDSRRRGGTGGDYPGRPEAGDPGGKRRGSDQFLKSARSREKSFGIPSEFRKPQVLI